MCAVVSDSRSAAMRAGRRSATRRHRKEFHQTPQCQLVTIRPEATDDSERGIGQRRVTTLRLPCVDVGQMDFDEWNLYSRERVTDGEAGVTVRSGVDERPVEATTQSVNRIDDLSFPIVL